MRVFNGILFVFLTLFSSYEVFGQTRVPRSETQTGRSVRSGRSAGAAQASSQEPVSGARRSRRTNIQNSSETPVTGSARSGRRGGAAVPVSSAIPSAEIPVSSTRSVRSGRGGAAPAARAGRSRGGVGSSVPSSNSRSAVLTSSAVPSFTPSAPAIPVVAAEEAVVVDKEQQLLSLEEAKKRFSACMDDFCATDEDVGRCLCSSNISQLRPLEDKVQEKTKQLFQMSSNIEAAKMGIQYELFNESMLEKMGVKEEDSEEPALWNLDSVDFGIEGLLAEDLKRKEGLALYQDAEKACKPYLDVSPVFKKVVVDAYVGSTQGACRAAENKLTQKLRRFDLAAQDILNKTTKAAYQTANKYNAGQCGEKIRTCLMETAECGQNFENCGSLAILNSRKTYCQDYLNQCQEANKGDVVWKALVNEILGVSSNYLDQQSAVCMRDLEACFEEGQYCGKDSIGCSSLDLVNERKSYCYDKLLPCRDKAEQLWIDFAKSVVRVGIETQAALNLKLKQEEARKAAEVSKLAAEQAEQKREEDLLKKSALYQQCANSLQSCGLEKCGLDGLSCQTDIAALNVKALCQASLMPCPEDADEIWNAFKSSIQSKGLQKQKERDEAEQRVRDQEAERLAAEKAARDQAEAARLAAEMLTTNKIRDRQSATQEFKDCFNRVCPAGCNTSFATTTCRNEQLSSPYIGIISNVYMNLRFLLGGAVQ